MEISGTVGHWPDHKGIMTMTDILPVRSKLVVIFSPYMSSGLRWQKLNERYCLSTLSVKRPSISGPSHGWTPQLGSIPISTTFQQTCFFVTAKKLNDNLTLKIRRDVQTRFLISVRGFKTRQGLNRKIKYEHIDSLEITHIVKSDIAHQIDIITIKLIIPLHTPFPSLFFISYFFVMWGSISEFIFPNIPSRSVNSHGCRKSPWYKLQ